MGTRQIAGPQTSAQPVDGIIGQFDGFFLAAEAGHAEHRAEDFLAHHGAVLAAFHDGRLQIPAAGGGVAGRDRLTALVQRHAFRERRLDEAEHLLVVVRADQCAHARGRVERITGRHGTGAGDQTRHEVIEDGLIDIQARTGDADFALIDEDGIGGGASGLVQVRAIGEHDMRRLAATLQPHTLEVGVAGIAHEALAGRGGTGEGQRIDFHVQAERLTRHRAQARRDVEHARRDAGFIGQCCQTQRTQA